MVSMQRKQIGFLAKFFLIFGFLHWLLFVIDISFVQNSFAAFEAGLLGLESNGSYIHINGDTYVIVPSCVGLVSAIILCAIVFSLKKPAFVQKLGIFLGASAFMFLVNIVRVYGVLLVGVHYGIEAAETAHTLSWFAMSGGIIFAWYYLTKKVAKINDFDGFL